MATGVGLKPTKSQMTPAQFTSFIRTQTKSNSTTFPDATLLLYANIVKDDIAKEITKISEDYFGMKFVRNLEAGKRKYSFPTDILNNIKYVQAKLDGENWRVLRQFDVNFYQKPTDEASILSQFEGKEPQFDIYGANLEIYSDKTIIDVADGLELWGMIYPKDLSSLSGNVDMSIPPDNVSFGMPRQLHLIWATKVIVMYKNSKDRPIPLTEQEANVDRDLLLAIRSLTGLDLNQSVIGQLPNMWNDGQDL